MFHIERLFYGFFPGSVEVFWPPISTLYGDGTAAWFNFVQNETALIWSAWGAWILQIIICIILIINAAKAQKKLKIGLKNHSPD